MSEAVNPATFCGDVAMLSVRDQAGLALAIFGELLGPIPKLEGFLLAAIQRGGANSYHNGSHACHVLLNTYRIVRSCCHRLDALDTFALLLSAICHDLEHCGVTNQFLIRAKRPLAVKYANVSPLENHSLFVAQDILAQEETAILQGLPEHERDRVTATMRDLILCTDLTNQETGEKVRREFEEYCVHRSDDFATDVRRLAVLRKVLICADIGIVSEPSSVYVPWVMRLFDETSRVQPQDTKQYYCGQSKFLEFFATPLYTSVAELQLFSHLHVALTQLAHNKLLVTGHIESGVDGHILAPEQSHMEQHLVPSLLEPEINEEWEGRDERREAGRGDVQVEQVTATVDSGCCSIS